MICDEQRLVTSSNGIHYVFVFVLAVVYRCCYRCHLHCHYHLGLLFPTTHLMIMTVSCSLLSHRYCHCHCLRRYHFYDHDRYQYLLSFVRSFLHWDDYDIWIISISNFRAWYEQIANINLLSRPLSWWCQSFFFFSWIWLLFESIMDGNGSVTIGE